MQAENHDSRVTARRVGSDIGKIEIEGKEYQAFFPTTLKHHMIGGPTKPFIEGGVGLVACPRHNFLNDNR